ncbi:MAG: (deoxy)nucleoside triphosphate pyrophosphohydrolase [Polyangiaceae bacterium]
MSAEHQTIRVVAAVIEQDGKYLITQRRERAALPLLWEFPGGKVEQGESDSDALQREILHRLGVQIGVGELISFVTHPYDHYSVELYLYSCSIESGEPEVRAVNDFRWVTSDEFESYDFTPADESSMSKLLGLAPNPE